MESRIKLAIEFLKHNQSFLVGDLRLSVNATGGMQITGWSHYTDFRNLSKAFYLEELNAVKQMFSDVLMSSEDLKRFVKGKEIEYYLDFDDYGKASVGICSEKHNHIKWYIALRCRKNC